jgi:predicted negative regulator of RcsB-dependent stress response
MDKEAEELERISRENFILLVVFVFIALLFVL